MLAEPKTKRRADSSPQDMFGHMSQVRHQRVDLGGGAGDVAQLQPTLCWWICASQFLGYSLVVA